METPATGRPDRETPVWLGLVQVGSEITHTQRWEETKRGGDTAPLQSLCDIEQSIEAQSLTSCTAHLKCCPGMRSTMPLARSRLLQTDFATTEGIHSAVQPLRLVRLPEPHSGQNSLKLWKNVPQRLHASATPLDSTGCSGSDFSNSVAQDKMSATASATRSDRFTDIKPEMTAAGSRGTVDRLGTLGGYHRFPGPRQPLPSR